MAGNRFPGVGLPRGRVGRVGLAWRDRQKAAAPPLVGLTAWQCLTETAHPQPGQRVLIQAAAGGFGHIAVQIAKALGGYVIGTARLAKHECLHGLAIDEVIDHRTTDFTTAVNAVDIVLDSVGGDYGPRSLRVPRRGGTLVSLASPAADARGHTPSNSGSMPGSRSSSPITRVFRRLSDWFGPAGFARRSARCCR